MSRLAPNLFQRRFDDLVEIGRARLPALAPEWTDHNLHDPGITLLELLAWVAEAQLYSLSRLRRDQRLAYAALLGIGTAGTRGASGLVWPNRFDPKAPAGTNRRTVVVRKDEAINLADSETPTFCPVDDLLLVPGHIERLETRSTGGRTTDHTATNELGGAPFAPLGGPSDVLAMTFTCHDRYGLFGDDRRKTTGALWPVGILAAPPNGGPAAPVESRFSGCSPLLATLITGDCAVDLRIVQDSTQGLLTTGVLLLDLDNVPDVPDFPKAFTLELRCPARFSRPPSVLRIEPNVIPILQGRTIVRERQRAGGQPDWSFKLEQPGLRFAAGDEPVVVEVVEPRVTKTWMRTGRLADHGPHENVYELDTRTCEVTFGNDVNGRIPPAGSDVWVTYSVSDGDLGGIARNRPWKVPKFAGIYGVNLEPIVGGSAPSQWIEQRREARRQWREDHALVSAGDITAAAKDLPLLEVARAWVLQPTAGAPRTGTVTLVAMRSRTGNIEPEQPPETPQWLEAIRRRLATRMPLGSRLVVIAPRYVEFAIEAELECQRGANPDDVADRVKKTLEQRLALVDSTTGAVPRQPGVPVTNRDLKAWLRSVAGVKSVLQLRLRLADGKTADKVTVPRSGLPRWSPQDLQLDVRRPEIGRAQ